MDKLYDTHYENMNKLTDTICDLVDLSASFDNIGNTHMAMTLAKMAFDIDKVRESETKVLRNITKDGLNQAYKDVGSVLSALVNQDDET